MKETKENDQSVSGIFSLRKAWEKVYFLGIGGIGMSALARYFHAKGFEVGGYDLSKTALTEKMEQEGIHIHYTDDVRQITSQFLDKEKTLVVITPAIPTNHQEWQFFRNNHFVIMKRAQVLGEITRSERGLCVAGTHGKTTTSNMLAHLLNSSHIGCNAFLGGISKNFETNLVLSDATDLVVIEADEFDRSFHQLVPYMAVITASDVDHLDIYETADGFRESFEHFTSLVCKGGCLLIRKGLELTPRLHEDVQLYSYSASDGGDFRAENIVIENGEIHFDFVAPDVRIEAVKLGVPMLINVENAVAAMALAWLNGVTEQELREGIVSFKGVARRFDFHVKTKQLAYLDDYAHHPEELRASIGSVKALFPDKKVCGIFQPHLYSRTKDFAADFAQALSLLDELILLDIYPARELPIAGVTSQIIFEKVKIKEKTLCTKANLMNELPLHQFDVLMTIGAGDIDKLIPQITEYVKNLTRWRN